MTSVDRREAYYERAAKLIAADPLGFYTRAEQGRAIQARIKPGDYATPIPKPVEAPKADNVRPIRKRA